MAPSSEVAARYASRLFVPVGSSFRCRRCGATSSKRSFREVLNLLCERDVLADFPEDVVLAVQGPISVRGSVLHGSHRLAPLDFHDMRYMAARPQLMVVSWSGNLSQAKAVRDWSESNVPSSYAGASMLVRDIARVRVKSAATQRGEEERCPERTRPLLAASPRPPFGGGEASGGNDR